MTQCQMPTYRLVVTEKTEQEYHIEAPTYEDAVSILQAGSLNPTKSEILEQASYTT